MGSSSSSSFSSCGTSFIREYYCSCSVLHYEAVRKELVSVSISGAALMNTARILSLGITEFWHKGQSIHHDCVYVYIRCKQCGHRMRVTMEYGLDGKNYRFGHYQTYLPDKGTYESWISRSYENVESIYNGTWSNMFASDYTSWNYNCKKFAKALYTNL